MFFCKLLKLKGTANYTGQLFAPAEGLWPLLKGYLVPFHKKGFLMQFWYLKEVFFQQEPYNFRNLVVIIFSYQPWYKFKKIKKLFENIYFLQFS